MTQNSNADDQEIEQQREDYINDVLGIYKLENFNEITKFMKLIADIRTLSNCRHNAAVLMNCTSIIENPEHYKLAFKAHEALLNLTENFKEETRSLCSSDEALRLIIEVSK